MALFASILGAAVPTLLGHALSGDSREAAENSFDAQSVLAQKMAEIGEQLHEYDIQEYERAKSLYNPLEDSIVNAARTGIDSQYFEQLATEDARRSVENQYSAIRRRRGGLDLNTGEGIALDRAEAFDTARATAGAINTTRFRVNEINQQRQTQAIGLSQLSARPTGIGLSGLQAAANTQAGLMQAAGQQASLTGQAFGALGGEVGSIAGSILDRYISGRNSSGLTSSNFGRYVPVSGLQGLT